MRDAAITTKMLPRTLACLYTVNAYIYMHISVAYCKTAVSPVH